MIVRIEKRENPFVQIDKRPLEDIHLSWRAKGILAYLISKPNNWEVRSEDIIAHGSEGRDAVRAAMAELRSYGYAKLEQTRNGKQWIVFEEPCPEKPSMEPCPEKPTPEKAIIGKSATSNNKKSDRNNEKSDRDLFPRKDRELSLNGEETKTKRGHKLGTVNGSHPPPEAVGCFCASIDLPVSDGEIMVMKWDADGWPKNWMDKIRYWKRMGYLPSQRGKQQAAPLNRSEPAGWQDWLKLKPKYLQLCQGLQFLACPEWIRREYVNERKVIKIAA